MRMGGVTNKNLKNIWLQNIEILHSFDKNSLSVNLLISFFIYKIISRILQFFKRHLNEKNFSNRCLWIYWTISL